MCFMAERVGIEPTHPFLNDGLATRCLNRSANAPIIRCSASPGGNYTSQAFQRHLTYTGMTHIRHQFT